jgi:hypothetical protein
MAGTRAVRDAQATSIGRREPGSDRGEWPVRVTSACYPAPAARSAMHEELGVRTYKYVDNLRENRNSRYTLRLLVFSSAEQHPPPGSG